MKRLVFVCVFFLLITGLSAQVDRRENSADAYLERDEYGDLFNKSILHIKDLQSLFGKSVDEMDKILQQRNHDHIMSESDNQVWAMNIDQLYDFPTLYLICHPTIQTMQYVCNDSSLINYLTGEFSRAGYRQISEQQYVNSKYEVWTGSKLFDVDEQQVRLWMIEIVDKVAQERRRAENAAKLRAFTQSMDSLTQVVQGFLDTARVNNQRISMLTESLRQSERMGDEYRLQHKYDKARAAYVEASDKFYKSVYKELDVAGLYVLRKEKQIEENIARMEQRYAPLSFNDLEKNYDELVSAVEEMVGYVEAYGLYEDFGMEMAAKQKANDCDELERDYKQLYGDRSNIENLYDQKGYERLKSESELRMKTFAEERENFYDNHKALLTFLKIPKKQFEKQYNEVGEDAMSQRMRQSYDSVVLCAVRQSPNIEKVNLRKSRVVKIDSKYKALFKQNTINLDDYKNSQIYTQLVNIVAGRNVAANKEYRENGHYFSSRQAFFNSYISPYYEKQLQSYKKAEKERKEKEELARKKQLEQQRERERRQQKLARQQQRNSKRYSVVYPPIDVFAFGLTTGLGVDLVDDFSIDYHVGMYMMFPTKKRVSWGLFANLGLRDDISDIYMTGGLQFFHGQYNKWQFLWGAGAGFSMSDGLMGTLRLGTRYKLIALFADIDVVPESDCMIGFKLGFGLNLGR